MNVPFRKRGGEEAKPIIPEMNGPAIQTTEQSTIRWPRLILAFVLAVLILAGLVAGGRWTYNKVAHHTKTTVATTTHAPSKPKTATTKPAPVSQPTQASNSQNANTSQPSATNQPQTATVSSNLSNTGPGDTLALFLFVVVASTIGYHFMLRRSSDS